MRHLLLLSLTKVQRPGSSHVGLFCSSPSAGMCKQNPVWNRDGSAVHHRRALWGQYCKPNTLSAGGVRGGCGAGCSTCMLTPVCMCAHSVSLGWCHIYVPHNIPSGWHAQKKPTKTTVVKCFLLVVSHLWWLLAVAPPAWSWAQTSDFVYI